MEDELTNYPTSGDGHLLIDKDGFLTGVNVMFNASGDRLRSILDITKLSNSFGIVVSQDATRSIIENGMIINRV